MQLFMRIALFAAGLALAGAQNTDDTSSALVILSNQQVYMRMLYMPCFLCALAYECRA